MDNDPIATNPDLYSVVMENEHVRVLEYRDRPGESTRPHFHPDSVMVTLSFFRRRLVANGEEREVAFEPGLVRWLPAQEHVGENIGQSDTHVVFVELKQPTGELRRKEALGPTEG